MASPTTHPSTQPFASVVTAKNMARHEALVKHANKLVGQTFYGTLLKQMDDSPFKDKTLSGGRGGQAFGSMLHQTLAERMVRGEGDKLSQSIARRIEGREMYKACEQARKAQSSGTQVNMALLPPAVKTTLNMKH